MRHGLEAYNKQLVTDNDSYGFSVLQFSGRIALGVGRFPLRKPPLLGRRDADVGGKRKSVVLALFYNYRFSLIECFSL